MGANVHAGLSASLHFWCKSSSSGLALLDTDFGATALADKQELAKEEQQGVGRYANVREKEKNAINSKIRLLHTRTKTLTTNCEG